MCLEFRTKGNSLKVGYKVFKLNLDGKLVGNFTFGKPRKINTWINEKSYRREYSLNTMRFWRDRDNSYTSGWHVYDSLEDARKHCRRNSVIRKVDMFMKLAHGRQSGAEVTVCKCIRIHPRNINKHLRKHSV